MASVVSIIIPTYNRGYLITKTLDAILVQSYVHWECIIVDDGSTDSTKAVVDTYVKRDSRIKFFERPEDKPKGANACRNYGLELAKGDYIQWFDSDDIMHPKLLENQIKNIRDLDVKVSICNFSFFRTTQDLKHAKSYNTFHSYESFNEIFNAFICGHIVLNTQTVFIGRELVKTIRFNEMLQRAQDLDFVYRLLAELPFSKIGVLDEPLVFIRRHSQSITDAFKNRDIKLIAHEIYVRQCIWRDLKKQRANTAVLQGSVKMYLKSLKYLLYVKKYRLFFKRLYNAFISVNNKVKLVIFKIAIIAIFYIFTGKGLTAYQRGIDKL